MYSMCRTMPSSTSATSTSAWSLTGMTLPLGRFWRCSLVTCLTCCGSLLIVRHGLALTVCPCTEPRVASTSCGHCHWLSGEPAMNRKSSSSSSRLSEYAPIACRSRSRISCNVSRWSFWSGPPRADTLPAPSIPVGSCLSVAIIFSLLSVLF